MADPKGVPEVIAVAPEGPGGSDDIQSTPNPEGPDRIWNLDTPDGFLVALAVGTAMIRLIAPPSGQRYAPVMEVLIAGQWKPVKAIVAAE